METSHVIGYEETLAILQSRFATMDTNPISALEIFFAGRRGMDFDPIWYFVWLLGITGTIFGLIWRNDPEENAHFRQIAAWILGIAIVSGFVPLLEQIVFSYLRRIPPEFELLRTLRYLVPPVLLGAFYALWLAKEELRRRSVLSPTTSQNLFVAASILLLGVWGISSAAGRPEFRSAAKQNISCWLQGKIVCPLPPSSMDFIELMDFIREKTPAGSRIFSEGQEVAIRYYAWCPTAGRSTVPPTLTRPILIRSTTTTWRSSAS